MEKIRLQKYLAQSGMTSRREAESWIVAGRLAINGVKAVLGDKLDPQNDELSLDGKPLTLRRPPLVYWLLNKPDCMLTSRKNDGDKECIYDLPKLSKLNFHVFPVGRLDYRTEGLLLLTNDGEMAHRLCHPSYKLPRSYQVLINGKLSKEEERAINKGLSLEDGPVRCELLYAHGQNLGRSKGSWYFVTVFEGRNRLVRRIFAAFSHDVVKLVRYGFGDLRLPEDLKPGEYRQLTPAEIRYLKESVDLLNPGATPRPLDR